MCFFWLDASIVQKRRFGFAKISCFGERAPLANAELGCGFVKYQQ